MMASNYGAHSGYGYQRPANIPFYEQSQSAMGGLGVPAQSAVYNPVSGLNFPVPTQVQAPTSKPWYRAWDANQKKWFFWEKDSSSTTWTEPGLHVTLIDHSSGSVVQRNPPSVPAPVIDTSSSFGTKFTPSAQPVSVVTSRPVAQPQQHHPVSQTTLPSVQSIAPKHSVNTTTTPVGITRFPASMARESEISAAEKARLEEVDRKLAEKLQEELSKEAEAELFASCPLPGEAAKIMQSKKKPVAVKAPGKAVDEDRLFSEMAQNGFVVKKQKNKKK